MKRSTRPIKRTPLRRISAKRKAEMATYNRLAKECVEESPLCQAWLLIHGYSSQVQSLFQALYKRNGTRPSEANPLYGLPAMCPLSTDCHHKLRRGKNYLNKDTFMAVSRQVHQLIHDRPGWAREMGLLV